MIERQNGQLIPNILITVGAVATIFAILLFIDKVMVSVFPFVSSFMIIGALFFIGIFILSVGINLKEKLKKLISELKNPSITESKEDSALEILKKRYASGEITQEEFNKIKEDLEWNNYKIILRLDSLSNSNYNYSWNSQIHSQVQHDYR